MNRKRIYFIGCMGAGKTTVGRLFASETGYGWLDTDRTIEEREGKSIQELFREKGEAYFREVESQVLEDVSNKEEMVFSCGGGMILDPDNAEYMKTHGTVIYLKATAEALAERLKDAKDRPILQQGSGTIKERIRGILEQREQLYEKAADIILCTDGKKPQEIVAELSCLYSEWK